MTLRNSPRANQPIYIVFIYCLFGSLWILFSDWILERLFWNNSQLITQFQTLKGWLFVFLTSVLLYELIRRSQQSLTESNSLLHAIVEGSSDAIFVKDTQGRYLMLNSVSAEILGYSPNAIIGRDDRDFLPPNNAREIQETDREIIRKGLSKSLEEQVITGGKTSIYWSSKYVWRSPEGEIKGLIAIARNITEQKQLMQRQEQLVEQLQQQTNDLRALSTITENGISTLDLQDLLQILLNRIVSVNSADAAVLLLYENNRLQPRSSVGVPESHLAEYTCKIGQGFSGLVAASREPIYIQDTQNDPRFSSFYSHPRQIRTLLGVPFRRNGRLVGVLQLEWQQLRTCDQREIHWLEIVAERCVMAILNAQLFEQTKHLQERLQLQIERMPIACILHDHQFNITDWNPAAEKIFGFSKAEVLGNHPTELIIPPSIQLHFQHILRRIVEGDMTAHSLNENLTKDGRFILCEWHNTPLRSEDGKFMGLLSMVQDVTERERSRDKLWRVAYYDSLTNLPNQKLLIERISFLLEMQKSDSKSYFSLIYLDINRFQIIKYTLGHKTAERLLIEVAHRLESCLEPPAMLARVDTDEFAILLEETSDVNVAKRFAERIRRQIIRTPFYLNDAEIFTSMSVGLVMSSIANAEAEELLRSADAAMHRAKINRLNECEVFDAAMQAEATRRLKLDTDLLGITKHNQLLVYYQPIVSLKDNKLRGFEALIRWQHPQLGLISPIEFIPIAEENGAIHGIGLWILRQACYQVKYWQQKFPQLEALNISVNLSPVQLKHPQLLEEIELILEETRFSPTHLKLEITENIFLEEDREIAYTLNHIKSLGIQICIDDFGMGYSSLSYLHTYPIDVLKIDRSFVTNLISEAKTQEIVRSVIILAKTLNMDIIAEGIETVEQFEYLKNLGCQCGQGYLFAKPLDSSAAEAFITNTHSSS
jgi:PAS domain S-box-containing protein/diguanylate cyclase (GGDEF)-like protein